MIYTTCKYVPEELFRGFGEETKRLDPHPVSFSCADGCAHPNLCGFAKAVIEEVKAEGIRELVLTDCCDAMRRTYDVLENEGMDFIFFLPLPHKTGEREIRYFARKLRELKVAYAAYSGKTFSWKDAYQAVSLKQQEEDGGDVISVLGAHGGSLLIEEVRKTFPGTQVRDETCSGNRVFRRDEETAEDEDAFFVWYARKLLVGLVPCLRMYEAGGRAQLSGASGRKGIIYHTVKFCDYYSFEYTDLKETAEVPLLKIETDTTPQSSGQLKTRLEAFGETIGMDLFGKKKKPAAEAGKTERGPVSRGGHYIAGIDSGSTSTDAVIMNDKKEIVGSAILPTGMSASASAEEALRAALREAGISRSELAGVVATGYGRDILEMEKTTITEITCHARGARYLFPGTRTIIDIGGQDSKVIRIDEEGSVLNFVMNDKCAAGTGRFLEMQARALGLSMEEMSSLGLNWKEDVTISNMCTVFAESEVVSLVARDTAVADIIHGLNKSVAEKTVSLVKRGKGEPAYAMTGGVSRNKGVVRCLSEKLGTDILISERSQLCGAIGAALLGWQ